eukprot:8178322-Pyramimonas_sp.AAC.1
MVRHAAPGPDQIPYAACKPRTSSATRSLLPCRKVISPRTNAPSSKPPGATRPLSFKSNDSSLTARVVKMCLVDLVRGRAVDAQQ